jgi:hypothetical protein
MGGASFKLMMILTVSALNDATVRKIFEEEKRSRNWLQLTHNETQPENEERRSYN